jgi:hypothetical protein
MKKKIYFLALLSAMFFINCTENNIPENFDYGKIENNVYSNSFFNCEIKIPDGWAIQSNEQMQSLTEVGQNLIAGDNDNMKAAIKASEINVANLLAVIKYELGAPTTAYNPGIAIVAENLKNFPGIKTGSDYLLNIRKLLYQSQLVYESMDENFAQETIGGVDFYVMNAVVNFSGNYIYQRHYATIINNFAFIIGLSYADNEQETELMTVLNSLKFQENL